MSVAGAIVFAWSFVVASTCAWAILRASRRTPHSRLTPPADKTSAILIRPCAGAEPLLDRTLSSTRHATWSFDLHVVFAIGSVGDAACASAKRAASELRSAGIAASVVITGANAPNRKADQIARVLQQMDGFDHVLVADSDVDLTSVDLDTLVAPMLDDVKVAACWAPPVERAPPRTWGDRASAALLGGSLHAFPLLGALDPRGLVGKLFAVRRTSLDAVGGFRSLVRHLGEDMELSRRLHERNLSVVMAPFSAQSLCAERDLSQIVGRYARWISVIRAQRPALILSYPALFCATPLILIAAVIVAFSSPLLAISAATVAVLARLSVAFMAQTHAGRASSLRSLAADAVLADALLWAAFVRALSSRSLLWRGSTLYVDGGGLLRESAR
jgi:ceramide glucosyltransferase